MVGTAAIASKFHELQANDEAALICFVTAGDPSVQALPEILNAVTAGGADLIEIGIPFSDPIADGPVIQASSQRALDYGVNTYDILETISKFRGDVPIVLMGYWNPILAIGPEKFIELAMDAEVSGAIVSDLIPEEATEWISLCRARNYSTIFLAAPTSPEERLSAVCGASTGFVYAVSRTGVTGAGGAGTGDASQLVARIRQCTSAPICVGFGIRDSSDVKRVAAVADGVVVGSALVETISRSWNNGKGASQIEKFVRELKSGTRRG